MEQVHAASVNPLDVDMRQGYLRELLATGREHPLPFVLGRDFSGEVCHVFALAGLCRGALLN
jgi:NADPH:quinone reductase-like Zn-dependent oxidoreductase